MQRFFRVSGPAVHQMVVGLEKSGLISRQPGVPRSIRLLVEREALPELRSNHERPVKTFVQEYSHVRHFKQQAMKFLCLSFKQFQHGRCWARQEARS